MEITTEMRSARDELKKRYPNAHRFTHDLIGTELVEEYTEKRIYLIGLYYAEDVIEKEITPIALIMIGEFVKREAPSGSREYSRKYQRGVYGIPIDKQNKRNDMYTGDVYDVSCKIVTK